MTGDDGAGGHAAQGVQQGDRAGRQDRAGGQNDPAGVVQLDQMSFLRWTRSARKARNFGPRSSRSMANSTVALR